jgi:hypothetical protein
VQCFRNAKRPCVAVRHGGECSTKDADLMHVVTGISNCSAARRFGKPTVPCFTCPTRVACTVEECMPVGPTSIRGPTHERTGACAWSPKGTQRNAAETA